MRSMEVWGPKLLRNLAILVAISFWGGTAWPAERCGSLDRVIVAADLLGVVYPELRGAEFSVALSHHSDRLGSATDGTWFSLTLDRPFLKAQDTLGEHRGIDLPFQVDFNFVWFSPNPLKHEYLCRPKSLAVAHDNYYQLAVQLARSHPEWSDAEFLSALREKGMRYGPESKVAVLKLVPWKALEKFYGPLRLTDAVFSYLPREEELTEAFGALDWQITARELRTGRLLGISMNPFTGKINSMAEHDPDELKSEGPSIPRQRRRY